MRYSLLVANIALLLTVAAFVTKSPVSHNIVQPKLTGDSAVAANPVDQISSADIAVHVARMTGIDESIAVVNHADTAKAQLTVVTSGDTVVSKPQVVTTDLKSRRDIISYTVKAGETVSALAARFNVTSDTIRWSNGISGEAIAEGKVIYVLPGVNGVVYQVKAGDTPDSLAARFQGQKDQIVAFNDAEGGLTVGLNIIIPSGTPQTARASFGFSPTYGSNGYDYGWCTWYVASKVAVPTNWGNANTWSLYAAASGWRVSKVPVPGAIGQNAGPGLGHVAVVESVSEDGSTVTYSDMNGLAGWGRVGRTTAPVSKFQNYIYR
jgi:surface antigen